MLSVKESCVANLLESFDCVSKIADKAESNGIFYVHFQKALDKVTHRKLLKKVSNHRMQG